MTAAERGERDDPADGGGRPRVLAAREIGELIAFGPTPDVDSFNAGLTPSSVSLDLGGEADLISTPAGRLVGTVREVVAGICAERDRA